SALDRLEAVFPQVAGASAQAITVVPEGEPVDDQPYRDAIEDMATALRAVDGVGTVITPFDDYAGTAITDDHTMARTQIQLDGASSDITDEQLAALTATASIGEDAGMQVEFGGQVFQQST